MADNEKTILVVDDDPDTRTYLTTVLEDNGFATVSAADGVEAMAKIEENRPDLIALDISMPEKSGVAVYRSLKEDDGLKSIPVIIITGVSDDFKKFISTRRQVPPPEGYISKPVDFEQLLSTVRGLLT
jgi:CheY-like chemotaxis protein